MKHFFLLSDNKHSVKVNPGQGPTPSDDIPEPLYPFEHDINTADGGEFLDDGIRMKDQPLGERTKEATKIEND